MAGGTPRGEGIRVRSPGSAGASPYLLRMRAIMETGSRHRFSLFNASTLQPFNSSAFQPFNHRPPLTQNSAAAQPSNCCADAVEPRGAARRVGDRVRGGPPAPSFPDAPRVQRRFAPGSMARLRRTLPAWTCDTGRSTSNPPPTRPRAHATPAKSPEPRRRAHSRPTRLVPQIVRTRHRVVGVPVAARAAHPPAPRRARDATGRRRGAVQTHQGWDSWRKRIQKTGLQDGGQRSSS